MPVGETRVAVWQSHSDSHIFCDLHIFRMGLRLGASDFGLTVISQGASDRWWCGWCGWQVIGALQVEGGFGQEFTAQQEELLQLLAGTTSALLDIMRQMRTGDTDKTKGAGPVPKP